MSFPFFCNKLQFWERLMGIDIHEAFFLGHKGLSGNVNMYTDHKNYMDALE